MDNYGSELIGVPNIQPISCIPQTEQHSPFYSTNNIRMCYFKSSKLTQTQLLEIRQCIGGSTEMLDLAHWNSACEWRARYYCIKQMMLYSFLLLSMCFCIVL